VGLPRRPCINGVRIAFRQEPCLVQNCPYTLLMSIEANFFYPTSLGTDRGDFKIQDLNCPNRQNACISKPTSSLYIFTPLQQNLSSFVTTCTHVFCTGSPCTALLSLHCVGRKNPRPSNPTSGRAINRYPAKRRICTFGTRRLVRSGVVIVVYL